MINIDNVSFAYENSLEQSILKNINLTIHQGEVVLLCGESGCGKTTVTRLINGLIPHYYEGILSGRTTVDAIDVSKEPLHSYAGKIGSVFQNPRSQFFNVDVESELAFGCENLGLPDAEIETRVGKTINELSIQSLVGKSIFALSGGEKQKIACGSATTLEPDVLVLDEPTSNLDLPSINALAEILREWKRQGKTIVIAEHRLYFLREIVDRIIYMDNGKIVREYSHDEFFQMPKDDRKKMGLRALSLTQVSYNHFNEEQIKTFKLFNFIHHYGKHKALDVGDLELPHNQIIGIVGHNGAGKTTLSRCLCGLEKSCKGTLICEDAFFNRKKRLSSFFLVMQDVNHQLFTERVIEEVLLSMPVEREEVAEDVLRSLDLLQFKDMHPMALSGGQKQRVAIACAIASERQYIVFDEPTSGLDYRHMMEVAENIKKLKEQKKTVFVVTHDMEFLAECCNYIISLERGCVK